MYKQLLVPVDGSEPSMLGLREAIKIAKSNRSRLQLVHVVDEVLPLALEIPPTAIEHLTQARRAQGREVLREAERVVLNNALECECVLLETVGRRAADLIVEQAERSKTDLIVMGTHGRRGLRRLALGSDAEFVVRSSPVPVLLVRGAGREGAQ